MCAPAAKLYRPRHPEALPFYKLVRDHFDEFERVYDERFQPKYGYWRPAIRSAMDKFLTCGDVREGFARIRCPGMCLAKEVFAPVGHRQWVLTMPKRLRIFFRNDRR